MSTVTLKIPAQLLREILRAIDVRVDEAADAPRPEPQGESPYAAAPMTEPQRRLIYRLAFQLGNSAEAVRDLIRHRLGMDPTRDDASRLIDELKHQVDRLPKNGGRHAAS